MSTSTTLGEVATTTSADVVIDDAGKLTMKMVSSAMGIESTTIMLGDAMYMNMGELSQGKYIKIDLDDPNNPMAGSLTSMEDLADPAKSVESLRDSMLDLEKVGEEEVGGVSATHYKATIDTSESSALQDMLGEEGSALASLPASLSYDLWVDGDNRLLKMTMDAMGVVVETTYSDWNDPSITVEAPSADEIIDEDLLGLGGGEG